MTSIERIRAMLAGGATAREIEYGGRQILVDGGGRHEHLDLAAVNRLYAKYDPATVNDMIRCELRRAMIPLVKQEKRR